MGDKYLFGQCGVVAEVYLPGKAILTFNLNDAIQRVLLWVKGFVYQGKNLGQTDNFHGKLNAGETIFFDCHVYDRESRDKCTWYAAKAWKETREEVQSRTVPRVMNQTGRIFELDPGKGVILFDFHDQEERVFFMRSKFYYFGKRPGAKRCLSEFLSENDPVQFDAQQCEPNKENKNCRWFSSLVWKGKKPGGLTNAWGLIGTGDDIMADDSISNASRDVPDETDFPNLTLPPGLSERHGYKAFEANSTIREGRGNVLHLINEESGIALWMTRQNTWETVFFHRKNSFLMDINLSKFDLHESLGTQLEIQAVPAIPDFPCKWIAHKAVATC